MRHRWKIVAGLILISSAVAGGFYLYRKPPSLPDARSDVIAASATRVIPQTVGLQPPSRNELDADKSLPFQFRRLIIDSSGDIPQACFRFSRPLLAGGGTQYQDYIRVSPSVAPAIQVKTNDLCIAGIQYGEDYKITIAAGLPAETGEKLAKDEIVTVSLGDQPARISIDGDGYILPRASSTGLSIATVNVDRVRIHVLRMGERLLPQQGKENLNQRNTTGWTIRNLLNNQASLIWSGEMAIPRDHNRTVNTAFPLAGIVKPDKPGAYLAVVENPTSALPTEFWKVETDEQKHGVDNSDVPLWQPIAAHWVMVSDIALTAMSGADGLHVSARSLDTAEPMQGVKLSLVATGQDILGETTTDAHGQASFAAGLLRGTGAAEAATVMASGEHGDMAMLDLKRSAFDLSDRGDSGRPLSGPLDAYLYSDRGIYRPGETVEVMALLRDRLGVAVENTPLTLILRRPDGLEAKRFTQASANLAGFHQSVELSKTAALGMWSVEAFVDPTGDAIGRVQFNVQDFVLQTLKVSVRSDDKQLRPNAPFQLHVDGQFLYGAPAAGLHGEAELRVVRDDTPVPDAKGYSFGLVDDKVEQTIQTLKMPDADDAGQVTITDVLQPPASTSAPLKGILSAGLFEPSGRIVKDQIELPLRQQPMLIGLKPRFADSQAQEDKPATIDIRAFDDAGNPIAKAGLQWTLIRENKVYDWFQMEGDWRWHYHTVDEPIASGAVDTSSGAPVPVSQTVSWGTYRFVVTDPDAKSATSIRFDAGWAETAQSADTPDKVKVTVDKTAYVAGDKVRLRIDAPFDGKGQLTLASDKVFETREFDVAKGGTTLDLTASDDWGSGIYAIVSIYRPLGSPDRSHLSHQPVRAVGLAWIGLDSTAKTLAVAILAPDKVTPRHRVDVPLKITGVKAGEETYVTLAAVDEGILQLTRFTTPDPAKYLFAKRLLGIDIRDDYGRLLTDGADPGVIQEGGDAAIGGRGLEVTSTRTVALFSGSVKVDGDGSAHVTIDVPDFEGQLRLMAVAYGANAVGNGEAHSIVRDPVIADLALPRFLAPGDQARLALSLHNTDGVAGKYHLDLTANGPASLTIDHPLDYQLAAGQRKPDYVDLNGLDEGISSIKATLTGPNGYNVSRNWQIQIRAPHYPLTIEDTARQSPGQSFTLAAKQLDAFVPGSVTMSVGYSAFEGVDVASLLQSLYRYPYGCTEQLVSTTFPLLYYDDPILLGRATKDESVKARIKRTIDTLLDRQDANGKFGLWRANDGEAPIWLNVYTIEFLVHAREAGYTIPEAPLRRSFIWLAQMVRQIDQENGGGDLFEGPQATRAYAMYVMARSGRAEPAQLRYAHDTIDATRLPGGGLALASVYWGGKEKSPDSLAQSDSLGKLGGALWLMGDHARGNDAFQMAIANLGVRDFPWWWFSYTYYTDVQDTAGLLAVAAEVDNTSVIEQVRQHLVDLHPSSEQMDTQDKAWILRAIHALNRNDHARSLTVNGNRQDEIKLPTAFSPSVTEARTGFNVTNSSERDLWRTLVIRGAPKVAPSAMEAGYTIKKEYFALDGQPVDPTHLKQNDRFIVSLEGENKDQEQHRTVIADLLPAGWEIETPIYAPHKTSNDDGSIVPFRHHHRKIGGGSDDTQSDQTTPQPQEYDFLGPLTRPQIMEARDDRFVAAFTLGSDKYRLRNHYYVNDDKSGLEDNQYHLAYIVRVVTPGKFTLPEAVIEDMYRPGVMGRTDAGQTSADPR